MKPLVLDGTKTVIQFKQVHVEDSIKAAINRNEDHVELYMEAKETHTKNVQPAKENIPPNRRNRINFLWISMLVILQIFSKYKETTH